MTETLHPMSKARDWEPATYTTQAHADLRASELAPKAFKENPMRNRTCRKRSFNDINMETQATTSVPMEEDMQEVELTAKRQRVEGAPHRKASPGVNTV